MELNDISVYVSWSCYEDKILDKKKKKTLHYSFRYAIRLENEKSMDLFCIS